VGYGQAAILTERRCASALAGESVRAPAITAITVIADQIDYAVKLIGSDGVISRGFWIN